MLKSIFDKSNKVSGPITVADFGSKAWAWFSTLTTVSSAIAWASTAWDWYWTTLSWAGVAFAFAAAWLVLALGTFLAGYGVAAWRGLALASTRLGTPSRETDRTAGESLPEWLHDIPQRLDASAEEIRRLAVALGEVVRSQGEATARAERRIEDVIARLTEIETTLSPAQMTLLGDIGKPPSQSRFEDIERRLDKLNEEIKAANAKHLQLHDKTHAVFVAKQVEHQIDELLADLDSDDAFLSQPTNGVPADTIDWREWHRRYQDWRRKLNELSLIVARYENVRGELFFIPEDAFKSHGWTLDFSHFSNQDDVVDYKSYRILRANLEQLRRRFILKVKAAATVSV